MRKILLIISLLFISIPAHAVILPGLVDIFGNPVHTMDEVDVQVNTVVQTIPQGYRYTYTLTSMQSSKQNLSVFEVYLPDPYTSIIPGFEASPWQNSKGDFPNDPTDPPPSGFVYSPEVWSIGWVALYPQYKIQPGGTATGFTFVSPYPPGNAEGYIRGWSNPPVTAEDGPNAPEFYYRTKYGPGKIIPVIGPVKPVTPNVTDNYSVIGCAGGICDVQLDITGPQDPYDTTYSYLWSGAFGSAIGAKPVVQLAAGAYNVSVSVSDPYATLVTATMPITVVDSNPPVVIPPVVTPPVVTPPIVVANMTPAQVAALTPAQLATLTPTQVASVIALLSPTQVAVLTANQLSSLTPVQAAALTPAQLATLTPAQVASVIALLSPTQVAVLTANQLSSLTPAQVNAVSPLLTPTQLSAVQHGYEDDGSADDDSDSDDEEGSDDDSSDDSSDDGSN